MAKWEKLGRIFHISEPKYEWMTSHAANPVAEHVANDIFRVYFSCRDAHRRSSIAFVEIDIKEPNRILRISDTPVLSPGQLGLFDDSGVSMGWIIRKGPERLLYYLGWNLGVTVPWRNSIGLAISKGDNLPFERFSLAPVLDRCAEDPYSISYPGLIYDDGKFRMLYGSNLNWGREQRDMAHCLKYAESHDGINWHRTGEVAIGLASPDEYAMSKPSIIKDSDRYRVWYSYRGLGYRIGYAESQNGLTWQRRDSDVGITVSSSGWDSETIEYPNVFDHCGTRYMLYNGNRYGLTGFGLAAQIEI